MSAPLAVSLSLLLAASPGQSSVTPAVQGSPRAPALNACELISPAEISGIIGVPVEPGMRNDSGWITQDAERGVYSSTCLWRASTDREAHDPALPMGGASFAILNVFAWPRGSEAAGSFLQKFREAAKQDLIPSTPVELKIGDEALWWGDGVAVKAGNIAFGISVHLVNGRPKERQMEETLGAKLAARLAGQRPKP